MPLFYQDCLAEDWEEAFPFLRNPKQTDTGKANKRDVWPMASAGYKGSHCAPFPEELPKTCILASTKEGDTVLDPFVGSGTTAVVAQSLGRKWIGIDLDTTEAKGRLAC